MYLFYLYLTRKSFWDRINLFSELDLAKTAHQLQLEIKKERKKGIAITKLHFLSYTDFYCNMCFFFSPKETRLLKDTMNMLFFSGDVFHDKLLC